MTTTATHNGIAYQPVYTSQEWQPEPIEPWTPYELVRQMEAVGWVAQPDPGHYIHSGTGYKVDLNGPDKYGDPVWLTWAVARLTPPPFDRRQTHDNAKSDHPQKMARIYPAKER